MFPYRNTDAKTVIEWLNELFAVFGLCVYVHSDCGPAFLSNERVSHLNRHGIACCRTSVYDPRGNAQCERCNGIIWSSVKLALKSRGLDVFNEIAYFRMLCTQFVPFCALQPTKPLMNDYLILKVGQRLALSYLRG